MIKQEIPISISILIKSASGLKHSDWIDKSDPYILCRIGKIDSEWDEKLINTERCSDCVSNSLNPEWNFAIKYILNNTDNPNNLELHIKIMDADYFDNDDFLGDVKIKLSELLNNNEEKEYDIMNGTGKIVVMNGVNINAEFESLINTNTINNENDRIIMMKLNMIKQFESLDDNIIYSTTMIKFLLAGVKSDTGLREWLLQQCNKYGDSKLGIWYGPEDKNCITYMNHEDVSNLLKELPKKFGTNNINGSIERQNNLGFQKLNNVIWSELKNPVIGLAQDQETHFFVREYITKVVGQNGKWNVNMIKDYVKDFFETRDIFSTSDYKIWTTRVLHKIHFDIELSWDEAIEFMDMQRILLLSISPPESLMKNQIIRKIIGLDDAILYKKKMLEKYKIALYKIFPDLKNDITILASNFMDSILFAGGQSVPTVLTYCTSLLYSDWLYKKIPNFTLDSTNITNYIMEVIRYFPPVSCIVYREKHSKSIYLSLHTAQCDKKAWGDDAYEFKLRPMSTYLNLMVGWANGSIDNSEKFKYNSRECPGKDLSIVMIVEMMKGFINSKCFDKHLWLPDKKPNEIQINGYNITNLTLTRNKVVNLFTDEYIKKLWYNKNDTKFDNMDGFTKLFISIVKETIDPTKQENAINVDQIEEKQIFDKDHICDFGNLRLINHDEEDINKNINLVNFIKSIGFTIIKSFKFEDKLNWFDSVEEGIVTMQKELLTHLPYQYNYWNDITSDIAIQNICFDGLGQYYITQTQTQTQKQKNNEYIIDLSHLGKYETREKFCKYGHKIYFNKDKKLVSIFSCHYNKMFYPNDTNWENIKFGFKSSLITDMTLRIHLSHIHFIISNSMMISSKETLSKLNPLRRLLKPHYHRSSVINWAAKDILVPVNQLAHRTWAFTENSWKQLFNDVFNNWKYETFRFKNKYNSVTDEIKNLSYYSDGILLWNCINEYIIKYINKMDNSFDSELNEFWDHINRQINYGLPEFNKDNLIEYITDTIWWCTGGHEMAGSIVEYLINPQGCMPKYVDGKNIADVQTYAQALIIISLTGLKQPKLMDDWSHIFTNKEFSEINNTFQKNLQKVSNIIKIRNEKRNILYKVMDPSILESSVSI